MRFHCFIPAIAVVALVGCATVKGSAAPHIKGWRAHATPEMLRLYDEFGSPARGGVLKRQENGEAIFVFPDGHWRSVVDSDANGRPESIEDTLADGTIISALDSDQDGRLEALRREGPLPLLVRDAWSLARFGDRDRNGVFDALETQHSVPGNRLHVIHHVDAQEDGHFVEVESRFVTAVFACPRRPSLQPSLKPALLGPRPMNPSVRP